MLGVIVLTAGECNGPRVDRIRHVHVLLRAWLFVCGFGKELRWGRDIYIYIFI